MPVISNAAQDELDSPFYSANKEKCQLFDDFFTELGGGTNGNYNAFSYYAFGKVPSSDWVMVIKRSQFTHNNLLLSSNYQGLLLETRFILEKPSDEYQKFKLRRRKWFDVFRRKSAYLESNSYILVFKGRMSEKHLHLIQTLQSVLNRKELFFAENNGDRLEVFIHTNRILKNEYKDLIGR